MSVIVSEEIFKEVNDRLVVVKKNIAINYCPLVGKILSRIITGVEDTSGLTMVVTEKGILLVSTKEGFDNLINLTSLLVVHKSNCTVKAITTGTVTGAFIELDFKNLNILYDFETDVIRTIDASTNNNSNIFVPEAIDYEYMIAIREDCLEKMG